MYLPKSFEELVKNLSIFPGVGEKTAERFVYSLLDRDEDEISNLSNSLINFKKNIKYCECCGCLSDYNQCEICSNKGRDKTTICVVEDSKSVFNPEDLNISTLLKRINSEVKEIIIALNPSIVGEVTSMYIQKILEKNDVKVSRLSYGIPMGSDIEYLDPIMISKAWDDRKVIS